MKHTPKPWKVALGPDHIPVIISEDMQICRVYNECDESVIAAAPDLLECLKHIFDLVKDHDSFEHGVSGVDYNKIEKVIAKAEGRE